MPTVFAYPATQQPLALRSAMPGRAGAAATSPTGLWAGFVDGDAAARATAAPALKDYDFIVFTDREPFAVPASACLTPLAATPRFSALSRVSRAIQCCF